MARRLLRNYTSLTLQPIGESERIELLDVLRGFALLGILVVNFHGEVGTLMPALDALVASALSALVSESFYPLFSFLFGLGFAIQLARARDRGKGASLLYIRRMAILLLIGTVHSVFIWGGDILVRYAITGLVLVPLHRLPQRVMLALTAILFITILNGDAVRTHVSAWRGETGAAAATARDDVHDESAMAGNWNRRVVVENGVPYVRATLNRWHSWIDQIRSYGNWLTWVLNDVLFFFLVGVMMGRARVLHEAEARRRTLVIAGLVSFAIACAGLFANTSLDLDPGFAKTAGVYAENLGVTGIYITGIAVLYPLSGIAHRALAIFALPGRMGLTNYLMQSLVMTWMSFSYGLGWQPSTAVWLAVSLVFFFAVQVPLSHWWLKRFRYGPAEWLWRSLTYGKAQPMRLPPARTVFAPSSTMTI